MVLRVPVLYGSVEEGRGNAESAVNCLMDVVMNAQNRRDGERKVGMDHWALRYPTNTEDVARVCYGELSSASMEVIDGNRSEWLTLVYCRRGCSVLGRGGQGGAAEGAPVLERG